MNDNPSHDIISRISALLGTLTPKARTLGIYIINNPTRAVFMTTRELAEACGTSEATVVRFVAAIGFNGYAGFQQALKDYLNTGLSLSDRLDIKDLEAPGLSRLHRGILEELNNLKYLYENIDLTTTNQFVDYLEQSCDVYFTGSRLSYTFAYYFGWSMTKVRPGVHILKGSDSTSIDRIANAPEKSTVVLCATTRYPNELIKLAKMVRRAGHTLLVLTDSDISPVIPFADLGLVVPSESIPFIGNISGMLTVIQFMIQELAARQGKQTRNYQQLLEQVYLENDILFNPLSKG